MPVLAEPPPAVDMPGPGGAPGVWLRLDLSRDALAAYVERPALSERLRLTLDALGATERRAEALDRALAAEAARADRAEIEAREAREARDTYRRRAVRRAVALAAVALGGLALGVSVGAGL